MKSQLKKNILIISIILLLVINITALLTMVYNGKIKNKHIPEEEPIKDEIQFRGMNYFFRNELNLSEEQFESFKEINMKYMNKSRIIAENLHDKRILLLQELANKNPDMEILDNISKEIGSLHYELKQNTIAHFIELKSICNDDQQVALQKIFEKIIQEQDREQRPGRNMDNHKRERRGQSGRPKR